MTVVRGAPLYLEMVRPVLSGYDAVVAIIGQHPLEEPSTAFARFGERARVAIKVVGMLNFQQKRNWRGIKMLPSERLELSILKYVQIPGAERWRATSLPSLASSVKSQDWNEVTDAVIRLHARSIIMIRMWIDQQGFMMGQNSEEIARFFNSGEFQLEITPEGRVYMEALSEREKLEKALALQSSGIPKGGVLDGMLEREVRISEEIRKVLYNRTVFEQQTMEIAKGFQEPFVSTEAMQAVIGKISLGNDTFYKSLVDNLKLTDLQYWSAVALAVEPTLRSLRQMGIEFAKQMAEHSKAMEPALNSVPFQSWMKGLADQSAIIARMSLKIPDLVNVYWPPHVMLNRLPLVEDSIWNAQALETLRAGLTSQGIQGVGSSSNSVEAASHFVENHVHLVGSIPPSIPIDETDGGYSVQYHGEEIGAKLEQELGHLGKHYIDLRRAAWRNFKDESIAGARIAMAGMRELYSDVLRLLSADDELKKTEIWMTRKNPAETRPTRKMRLEFIVGGRLVEYDALAQFDKSMENAHKFTHTFSEDPELVRVSISQIEICLYLLLISSRRGN